MKTLTTFTLILFVLIGIKATAQVSKEEQSVKFKLIDRNGDAVISKDEMIAFYKGKTDEKGFRIFGIVLFSEKDTNKDNIVSLEEFLVGSISKEEKSKVIVNKKSQSSKKAIPKKTNSRKADTKALSTKDKKKKKFRRIDLDDDKRITLWEMVDFHRGKKNKKGEQVQSELIFYGLDKNKDNVLTLKEYLKKVDWQLGKRRYKLARKKTD